jgi:O-antigen/teichoic acid export membrane protein
LVEPNLRAELQPATALETREVLVARMVRNTFVQAGGAMLGTLLGFATFLAVTRGLGPAAFGDIATASVYLLVPAALADVGFAAVVLRDISAAPDRTEYVMRASVPLRVLVAAVFVGLATLVALIIPFDHRTKVAIGIAAPGAFFTLVDLALLPILQAQLRMHLAALASLVGRSAILALTLVALGARLGFEAVVAAGSIGLGITLAIDLVFVGRLVSLRPLIDTAYWRSLVRESLALGVSGALALIYFRIDTLILALARSARDVGLYGAAYKFIEVAETSASFAATSAFPTLARLSAELDRRLRAAVQRTFDALLAAAVPLTVIFFVFPRDIIEVTAGPRFVDADSALRILAPYVLFSFVAGVLWRTLIAGRADRTLLVLSIAVLGLNVGLNIVLVPRYGYNAAAVTSVVSQVVATLLIAVAVKRVHGFLPSLGYLVVLAPAAAVMVGVAVLPSLPFAVAAPASVAAYIGVVAVAPGTIRDAIGDLFHVYRNWSAAVTSDANGRSDG